MRKAIYGTIGVFVGITTYVTLLGSLPPVEDVKSTPIDFYMADNGSSSEGSSDLSGDRVSYLSYGSYHLSKDEIRNYNTREVVKYGKPNPMFYYLHKSAPEPVEDEESNTKGDSKSKAKPKGESDSSDKDKGGKTKEDEEQEKEQLAYGVNVATSKTGEFDIAPALANFSKEGVLPVHEEYYAISSPFGLREDPFTSQDATHSGLDISAQGINNSEVFASSSGVITYMEKSSSGYGNHTIIKHDGYETLYAHMSNFADISIGSEVTAGDVIGYVGSTGRSSGPHLHFEVRVNGSSVDPVLFINKIRKG